MWAGVVLGQGVFQRRIVALDGDHCIVKVLADGWLLCATLNEGPAGCGRTQKTFSARYSSRSSGSAPFSFCNAACFSSKASEMYFRKIRPRMTCLYSAASRLPRSLSAVAQSVASKPSALLPEPFVLAFLCVE